MFDRNTIARALIDVCRKVEQKGFVAATDGNISARLPDGNILATPTALNKGLVTIDDLVEISIEGKQISGIRKPSTEMLMHLFIYQHRTDVNAVVHCHPVYATGFATARVPLKENLFPEVVVQFGEIPLAEYATPSTPALGRSLEPFIKDHDAVLLANHGVVTYGKDVWDAYLKMEKVEQAAQIQFVAQALGGAHQLNHGQIAELKDLASTIYKKE